jgi:hypothetical protein
VLRMVVIGSVPVCLRVVLITLMSLKMTEL